MLIPSILFPLLLPFTIIANPLALNPAQSPDLNTLTLAPVLPPFNTSTTTTAIALAAELGCFKQTKVPPFLPTNKPDCEVALDSWVRGQSLTQIRKFSRSPSTLDDVMLPVQKASGSCIVYLNVIDAEDEDALTLAEVYAELLGPDGVMKQCLGQVRMPAIGGKMSVGRKGVVKVAVMGR